MKVALYAWVSTERQAERGTIGCQLAVVRDQVSAAGHELVGEFVDDGHSGARPARPGLDALRDAAAAALLDTVWCLSPDRLARVYAYQVLVLDELALSLFRCISPTPPTSRPTTRRPPCSPRCRG